MKIIVSTKDFVIGIREAIERKSTHFDIIGEKSEIIYFGNGFKFSKQAMPIVGHEKHIYQGNFDPVQWYRMMKFIEQLTEQPLVLFFREYMHTTRHEEPEITLEQFVKCF